MSQLRFHNTLTGAVEAFRPIAEGAAKLYVCGITPYDETHLGHARCYVVFDVLRRFLQRQGFAVEHVQNFTDVDDKIIERANKLGKDPLAYPAPYIDAFKRHMARLNVLEPAYQLVTDPKNMDAIRAMIEKLVKGGLAYEVDGSVYFRVREFDRKSLPRKYGDLSKRNVDDLVSGARVEVDDRKEDPLDFALWKKSKPGEPSWDFPPYGRGRPGWHIECSAIATRHLGEVFDIHGGGLDLVFPHHTNEIAQSVGATGREFARLWMHNGFVTVNQQKMSKSLGNFFTLTDIFAKFDPMAVRYFLLAQHYRSPLNFSDQELSVAAKTWTDRICGAYRIASGRAGGAVEPERDAAFEAALADDLNTAEALGVMNAHCSVIFSEDALAQRGEAGTADWRKRLGKLVGMLETLGLKVPEREEWPAEVLELLERRQQARLQKDWKESDRIRDEMKKRGVTVEDSAAGPRLKRIS